MERRSTVHLCTGGLLQVSRDSPMERRSSVLMCTGASYKSVGIHRWSGGPPCTCAPGASYKSVGIHRWSGGPPCTCAPGASYKSVGFTDGAAVLRAPVHQGLATCKLGPIDATATVSTTVHRELVTTRPPVTKSSANKPTDILKKKKPIQTAPLSLLPGLTLLLVDSPVSASPVTMFTSVLLWGYVCSSSTCSSNLNDPKLPSWTHRTALLGNMHNLSPSNPLNDMEKLRKIYGNVYSIYIGHRAAVMVNGTQALKEALVNKGVDFAGRPQDMFMNDVVERRGVVLADYGPAWKEHRRFALMTMRNFGMGKQSMEERIMESYSTPSTFWRKTLTVKDIIIPIINEHKKNRVSGEPQDFVDCYLDELEKRGDDGSSFCPEELFMFCLNIYGAGTDTTSSTLLTGFLYLMTKPHIQERCQQEIDRVLEGKDILSFEDRNDMPYVMAVIHEIQRIANIVPLSVFHATTKDTQLMGYSIPKGTIVIPNLSSALTEEGQWKFPHEFNPENFLNQKGEFVKPDAFLVFSAGPRVCMEKAWLVWNSSSSLCLY
ncbi:hypothetical protein WMY93_012266 [Mugilogobius chulae]|uniref:Uncharacterized protein n=1 Tax=Mugilogobius chulae TaxID=88201 RepID=A0AAW0P4Z0_9GOBI